MVDTASSNPFYNIKGAIMYTDKNFKTKKALKEAVKAGEKVTYYQPGPFSFVMGVAPENGSFCVEGPHYPEPHKWYATCVAKDGVIVNVK